MTFKNAVGCQTFLRFAPSHGGRYIQPPHFSHHVLATLPPQTNKTVLSVASCDPWRMQMLVPAERRSLVLSVSIFQTSIPPFSFAVLCRCHSLHSPKDKSEDSRPIGLNSHLIKACVFHKTLHVQTGQWPGIPVLEPISLPPIPP